MKSRWRGGLERLLEGVLSNPLVTSLTALGSLGKVMFFPRLTRRHRLPLRCPNLRSESVSQIRRRSASSSLRAHRELHTSQVLQRVFPSSLKRTFTYAGHQSSPSNSSHAARQMSS